MLTPREFEQFASAFGLAYAEVAAERVLRLAATFTDPAPKISVEGDTIRWDFPPEKAP